MNKDERLKSNVQSISIILNRHVYTFIIRCIRDIRIDEKNVKCTVLNGRMHFVLENVIQRIGVE